MPPFPRLAGPWPLLLLAGALAAQNVPSTINYQGRLTDNTGAQAPVTGAVSMAFAIWDDPAGGSQLWREPANGGMPVTVVNGVFSVALGSTVPIPASLFSGATSARYLQITLNPGPAQELLAPRQLLSASAYAALAQDANSAADAAKLGAVPPAGWQRALATTACAAGEAYTAISPGGAVICGTTAATIPNPLALTGNSGGAIISGTNSGGGPGLSGASPGYGVYATGDGQAVRGENPSGGSVGYLAGAVVGAYGTGSAKGVVGVSPAGDGVAGTSTTGNGVYAYSTNGYGLSASSGNSDAIRATTAASANGVYAEGEGHAVMGKHPSTGNWGYIGGGAVGVYGAGEPFGVRGFSQNGTGIVATSVAGTGLDVNSTGGYALTAYSAATDVIRATTPASANGVYAEAEGHAVMGKHPSTGNWGYIGGGAVGLYGAGEPFGVRGFSQTGTGISADSVSGTGLDVNSSSGPGLTAASATGTAGAFTTAGSGATVPALTANSAGSGAGARVTNSNAAGTTYGLSAGVTSPNGYGLHTENNARVEGFLRLGAENGTGAAPSQSFGGAYRGLVIRRVSSLVATAGIVVAKDDEVRIERDGSNGGLRVNAPAALARPHGVYCTGLTAAGANLNKVVNLGVGASGSTPLYADADALLKVDCVIGNSYNNGTFTQLSLMRYPGDYFYVGTLTSSVNQ